jgi:ATP-dependent RNA helicase DDX3X
MPKDPTTIDWHDGTDDESDDGFGGDLVAEAPAFDADAGFGGETAGEAGGDTGFGGDHGGFGGGDFSADADDKVASW